MKLIHKVDINGKIIKSVKLWLKANPGGLYFDSEFERQAHLLLQKSGLSFVRNMESIPLQSSFQCQALSKSKSPKIFTSTVRPISYTPDYKVFCKNGDTVYLETKGFFREDARLRYKLFLYKLYTDPAYKKTFSFILFSLTDVRYIIKHLVENRNTEIKTHKKIIL